MAPRHRQPQAGQLRSHSRSSSSTRVGANLQITQKDPSSSKHADKTRKNDFHAKAHPVFVRANSSQRVNSKERVPHVPTKRTSSSKLNGGFKAGFILANQANQDDDDEWVSTESGAASPDPSDGETDAKLRQERRKQLRLHPQPMQPQADRPETPRPSHAPEGSDVQISASPQVQDAVANQPLPPSEIYDHYFNPGHQEKQQLPRALSSDTMTASPTHSNMPSSPHRKPFGLKRHSRTPSTHSTNDSVFRPHPLSHIPKQGPLAPLTVIPDSTYIDPTEATQPYHDDDEAATSPSSVPSDAVLKRRSSISSARSVSTVPVFHSKESSKSIYERTRTLSYIPSSSSSAALSSLTHLPTVTRPPSPQAIVFFPPHNPHANIDGIHPLLPPPYMSNHMTVLTRRTPLRESYDRVMQAKQAASR
ncbi:hypothetical protein APHAL10511_000120 [Amanita phalloides]|nr:hypothetical protein APHAL10511_000120 [Amanita phalloides]